MSADFNRQGRPKQQLCRGRGVPIPDSAGLSTDFNSNRQGGPNQQTTGDSRETFQTFNAVDPASLSADFNRQGRPKQQLCRGRGVPIPDSASLSTDFNRQGGPNQQTTGDSRVHTADTENFRQARSSTTKGIQLTAFAFRLGRLDLKQINLKSRHGRVAMYGAGAKFCYGRRTIRQCQTRKEKTSDQEKARSQSCIQFRAHAKLQSPENAARVWP